MPALIALEGCPGRAYGAEFSLPEGTELTELLLAGHVRVDDRMAVGPSIREQIDRAIGVDPEMRRADANLKDA